MARIFLTFYAASACVWYHITNRWTNNLLAVSGKLNLPGSGELWGRLGTDHVRSTTGLTEDKLLLSSHRTYLLTLTRAKYAIGSIWICTLRCRADLKNSAHSVLCRRHQNSHVNRSRTPVGMRGRTASLEKPLCTSTYARIRRQRSVGSAQS